MSRSGKFLAWFLPAAAVYAAGFAASAFYDLRVNIALYSPGNIFAVFMEALGWLPAFLPILLLTLLWATRPRRAGEPLWRNATGALLAVIGFSSVYYTVGLYLEKRGQVDGLGDVRAWVWLALGIAAALAAAWWAARLAGALRQKITAFALVGSVYMAANQALVYLMKMVWQRTRFDDMLAAGMTNFAAFTPWYRPFGYGGSSFPSGHTANMAGVFVLITLCDLFPGWNRRRRWVYVLCWVCIAAMGASRVVIGRHFPSDTLAASGLMALLFFALRRTKFYKNVLREGNAL